jgi:hypothetical protein
LNERDSVGLNYISFTSVLHQLLGSSLESERSKDARTSACAGSEYRLGTRCSTWE